MEKYLKFGIVDCKYKYASNPVWGENGGFCVNPLTLNLCRDISSNNCVVSPSLTVYSSEK